MACLSFDQFDRALLDPYGVRAILLVVSGAQLAVIDWAVEAADRAELAKHGR